MGFSLSFKNKFGEFITGGVVRISEIEGLAPVQSVSNAVNIVGLHGVKTTSRQLEPRVITVTGRLRGSEDEVRQQTQLMADVFDNLTEGVLEINMYGKKRKIDCVSQDLDFVILKNKINFIVSFKADNPFFYEWAGRKTSLFEINKLSYMGMEFPAILSEIITGGAIYNTGGIDIEPIVTIQTGDPTGSILYGLKVINETTGAVIELNYESQDGEVIIIDIANRKITSNINGVITRYINPFVTNLANFVLIKGQNQISFENANVNQPLIADITYKNLYKEAVY